ncbi:MAG: hypothetical protein MR368_01855 [Azospirillum sp.]|nr:hypothetical protein [Azospirillum sp.]
MALSSKKKEEDIKQISGATGVFHKIVMFITYPFRKPLRCLFFLAALGAIVYFIPVMYGVKPEKVYDWYVKLVHDVNEQIIIPHTQKEKGTDTLVESNYATGQREIRRQMFVKASGRAPQKVDVLAEEASEVVNIGDIRRAEDNAENYDEQPITPEKTTVEEQSNVVAVQHPVVTEDFDYRRHYGEFDSLNYLNEPVEVRGTAKIHNANELTVNDTYIFLYGIYSNPLNGRGVKAGVFLKNLVKDEEVLCQILAYTKEGQVATAECYVGETDINNLMVKNGFSDKVTAR